MNIYIAEFVGTYVLILLGVGVVAGVSLKKTYSNSAGWVVITFAWGLAVLAGVHVSGNFSGAHLNPAVTLGLAVAGDFAMTKVLGYIIAQVAGAFLQLVQFIYISCLIGILVKVIRLVFLQLDLR